MKIGTREVGPGAPVFVIAECGSNHAGSLEAALALVDAAADAGADAAKFQRFRVDSFIVPRPNPEALRPYELPDSWLPVLRDRCTARGLEFLCTAFDLDSLEAVDPYVNAYKVGSWEASKYFFTFALKYHEKPVIISNGATGATYHDDFYAPGIITLQCVSEYPAKVDGYLAKCPERFMGAPWGVSDHTLDPITVPAAAVALGACVVEKHLRLAGQNGTPDSAVSIEPEDFRRMVEAIMRTSRALGRAA